MHRRHTPPAPLKRGGLECCVFVGNEGVGVGFPSGEGIEGCVTERGAGWVVMIFAVVWRGGVSWALGDCFGF